MGNAGTADLHPATSRWRYRVGPRRLSGLSRSALPVSVAVRVGLEPVANAVRNLGDVLGRPERLNARLDTVGRDRLHPVALLPFAGCRVPGRSMRPFVRFHIGGVHVDGQTSW
jgi:hypothetical protein